MIRRFLGILFLNIILSCNSEKISLSPIFSSDSAGLPDVSEFPDAAREKNSELFYASELTNQVSTFPSFQNDAVNKEVGALKYHVKEYVYAIQEYNLVGRKEALEHLKKSYKKIQKLRKYLNPDDDATINRYLVRIKHNITQLEIINTSRKSGNNS